jgi:hypothetical protein
VGLLEPRSTQNQQTHGTQSMGFEVIHQPKSNAVFFFREIPWLMHLLLLPHFSVFFRG